MTRDDPKTLVSTQWLAAHLKDPDLRVLDASWYLPGSERDPFAEYQRAHIPGARFFDLDDVSDHRSDLPHMVPPVEKFMSRMRAIGVGDGHQIVVYDGSGLFSAPRVWWLFKLMGQVDIAVLDGGFPKWKAEGHPVEDLPPILRDRHMMVRRQNLASLRSWMRARQAGFMAKTPSPARVCAPVIFQGQKMCSTKMC